MGKGLTAETYALLTNPSIPSSLLASLYKKADCFAQVSESDWMFMIDASAKNTRLNTDNSDDSGPDLGFWDIHKAIFEFLEKAPVTALAVHVTHKLLDSLEPEHTRGTDEISHVLERCKSNAS